MSKETVTSWDYLKDNYEPSDRLAVLIIHHATGRTTQRLLSAESAAQPDFQSWLRFENANGASIYVSVNTLKPEALGRKKDDIQTIRHIYMDIDRNGPAMLEKVLADARLPQPSYVIASSPGKFQILWKVRDFDAREAEALQRTMVREYGADLGVVDSARVLRIPGFQNKKYDPSPRVTAEKGPDTVYTPADFQLDRTYEPLATPSTSPRRSKTSATLSQSERDWAYAKRALARGESPETVIKAIAAYRTDKPHASRYATHTVKKAAVVLAYEVVQKKADHDQPHALETKDPGRTVSDTADRDEPADRTWSR